MTVDTSVIGTPTGAWRVVLDRAVLAQFAKSVGDTSRVYQRAEVASAAGLPAVPAPPTFTFAAPYWSAFRPDEQPADPTAGKGNPMHSIMGELYAQGALVLHGEQEFTYHRPLVVGDVLLGEGKVVDAYEKDSKGKTMTFLVSENTYVDEKTGEPVVSTRMNLIHRSA